MKLTLKIPSPIEPLTLDEVKSYLRLSLEESDNFLNGLIASARAYVESVTGRALLKQQWGMELKPPYPISSPLVREEGRRLEIHLPHPPLLLVEMIKNGENIVAFSVESNKVILSPSLWDKDIKITFWAGYGETRESLPPDIKMALLMATRFFYDSQISELPLLAPYKVFGVY